MILSEMPHFAIGSQEFDLKAEKQDDVFGRFANILHRYNKEKVEQTFKTDKHIIYIMKLLFKKLPENEKKAVEKKFSDLGLKYALERILG